MANLNLWDLVNELKGPGYKWVNLTHELSAETPHWFGFALGSQSVEGAAATKHGFLDLVGNDWPDFAQVFADGFDLERGAQQKFKVALQIARCLAWLCRIESRTDEMMDVDFRIFLPVTVHTAIALFHPVWIPRDFVVNELPAMVL